MTLEEAFGPHTLIYKNVRIIRVSSAHERTGKDYVNCTYDYVELDNGDTIRNLNVSRSFYELIDSNYQQQTVTDLYVGPGQTLLGGLRSDGRLMLSSALTNSAGFLFPTLAYGFFGGIFWMGLLLLAEAFKGRFDFWQAIAGLVMTAAGGGILILIFQELRNKRKTKPFFKAMLAENELRYKRALLKTEEQAA